MWLRGELHGSWFSGIRCFSCDDRVYLGEESLLSLLQPQEAKGKPSGRCAGRVHVIIDVDLRWLYGAGLGRLKREGFTGRQSSLSHRESQTLNCLLWKLDFYPLRLGSGFPRSTEALLEKHAALWGQEKLTAQTSLSSRDLWPSRTSRNTDPTPGWLSSGCLSGCQTDMPSANCRCHLFDMAPPPLPPRLGRMTITTEEDKGESVFTETSRHEPPPSTCHLHGLLTDSQTILCAQHWY